MSVEPEEPDARWTPHAVQQVADTLTALGAVEAAATVSWAALSLMVVQPDQVVERVAVALCQAATEAEDDWVTEPGHDWTEFFNGTLLIESERDEYRARARALVPTLMVAARHG